MKQVRTKKADNQAKVLGVVVSSTPLSSVLEKIEQKCRSSFEKPFFIITAYSESLLEVSRNSLFRQAVAKADLVVPDGVSVLAAIDYTDMPSRGLILDLNRGLAVGLKVLSGNYQPTRGVDIFRSILESGKHRVYLTGGWNGVAGKLARRYKVVGWDEGERNIDKINATMPDIVFVSLGRFRQEIWIWQNLDKLKCKVIVGVGSAFDEVADGWQVPGWVDKRGLKWLWRVVRDPKHAFRALRALVVFPSKVFSSHLLVKSS